VVESRGIMVTKPIVSFLEKQVDFYFISDFPKDKFTENDLSPLKSDAVIKKIAFIWAEVLNEVLVEKVGNASYEQVIIVVSNRDFKIRRAEVLLGTRIKRIYIYNGSNFNYEHLFSICTEFSEENSSNEEYGIKRILNLDFTFNEDKPFLCVYNNHCLIETPQSLKIACLQLKGKRASAVYLENIENEAIEAISKIIPENQCKQVLLNVDKLSDKNKETMNKLGVNFNTIKIDERGELVNVVKDIKLPVLNEMVWDKTEFLALQKLNSMLKDNYFKNKVIVIAGDIDNKPEKAFEIGGEIVLRAGFQTSRENSLMFYKNKILEKEYVFINHKDSLIQQDLLRMLLTAGQKNYKLIAVGNQKDYIHLIQLYNEMMEKNFYKSKDFEFKIFKFSKISAYLEEKLKQLLITKKHKETEVEEITKDDIKERKTTLIRLSRQFDIAFQKFIDNIWQDFKQLSSIVVLSDKNSEKIITDSIMEQYRKGDKITAVFKNKEQKKKFHRFLKEITPTSSKTEFPENTSELVLIIKALIYKILNKHFNDSGNIDFILKKISTINLQITPFEQLLTQTKEITKNYVNSISDNNNNDFSEYLLQLQIENRKLEELLIEIVLQFNFVLLAIPSEMIKIRYILSKDLRNAEKRIRLSPFKQLFLIAGEIDNLLKTFK
jgi:hypothetical protein